MHSSRVLIGSFTPVQRTIHVISAHLRVRLTAKASAPLSPFLRHFLSAFSRSDFWREKKKQHAVRPSRVVGPRTPVCAFTRLCIGASEGGDQRGTNCTHTFVTRAAGQTEFRFRKSMHLFPASRASLWPQQQQQQQQRKRKRRSEGYTAEERLPNEIYSTEQQMRSFRESGHRHSARNARGGENHPGRFSPTR